MNQLYFFPARPAKEMCREQRGTVSARLLNNTFNPFNVFNAFKAFPEPNRARRMRIPARFYGVLLAGMFGLVLTGCGGGDPAPQNSPAVSNIQTLVGEDHILVGWTNPAPDNIDGFVITIRRDDASDGGTTKELNSTAADVAPLARVIYNITGLTNDITYHITIAVRYKNGIIGRTSPPVSGTTGADAGVGTDIDDDDTSNNVDAFPTDACASTDTDNDGKPDRLSAGCTTGVNTTLTEDPDDDNDGVADTDDAFRTDACASTDTDNDGMPDRLSAGCRTDVNINLTEDPDDDNDGVADTVDAFRTDACASTDTDEDGMPDRLSAGCRTDVNTNLIEDPDDDNDDRDDDIDNCPLVANAGQTNTDNAADGGDACDGDDDNDGVEDPADTCPTGVTGWTSNASADHDGDGCRDTDEDPDDDNDGEADPNDNCPLVANADQANTDNAADGGDACDGDDDNDGVEDLADTCPTGVTGWTSNASADHDGDGCRDTDEDSDDDNDGEADPNDNCPLVANADQTNTDSAADGGDACDGDDDNDGVEDLADTCPTGVTGWTSLAGTDDDGDGCRDNDEDVDDNNNRLIEIHTLDDLARLRDDLNGDGTDDGRIPEITSVGSRGCPDDGGCVGYELTRSFNFSDADSYAAGSGNMDAWTTGSGWQPIGSCSDVNVCTSYTGIFDGGGYRIADLFISASDTVYGVGLFGALTGDIQNLHLRNANVRGRAADVGGLVGNGRNADIRNASVSGGSVIGSVAGGLIGYGRNADIRNASVSGGSVFGNVAGGLVGRGLNADIRNASVSGGSVSGSDATGGLVGNGLNVDIRYASVSGGSVAGRNTAGGLVGYGEDADIRYASVSGVNVSGAGFGFAIGGLVGSGENADIRYAYVLGGSVSGNNSVGGLVGYGEDADIRYAYVLGGSVSGEDSVGGLVGDGIEAQINYSYAAPGLVSGSVDVGGLIGFSNSGTAVTATYWDNQTTMQSMSAGNLGEGHSTTALQSPTDFTGIYADWGNFWCNPNTGEDITSSSQPPGFIRVWDLGTSSQYPALNCLPNGLSTPRNSPAVSNIQTLVGEDHILVGWTNPNRMNITGFVITTRREDASDGGTTKELNSTAADVAPLARVIYNITGLTNNTAYNITIAVRYENGTIVTSPPVSGTTGADAGVGTDIDDDDTLNDVDAFVTDACASTDTDEDGKPDSLSAGCTTGVNTNLTEDPDDDNDGVADTVDAFRTDACASTDTDEDGMPDRLSAGCRTGVNTTLIEDPDDDNDDRDDDNDNCPLVANADQANTDSAADGGDACDGDDDNDGVEDLADTCPTGVTGWTSLAGTDDDGDGCRDNDEDVDDNNNGLIEIHTLDDLARLRDDLNGDGADDGRIPEITSVGSMGCPDDDDGGCEGYELTRSFNFSDADSYAAGSGNQVVWTNLSGSGWQPIGSCSAVDVCTSSYTGIFDGGGYRIADLFISANNTANGVGLFGALTGDIQNLHLRNANVSGDATNVGGLVGFGQNADIRNASVSGGSVSSGARFFAGGLVGFGQNADIRNASVSGVDVFGGIAGGLVGLGWNADIRNASVSGGSVAGRNAAGGLVGNGEHANIRNASVSGVNVGARFFAGGLVGFGEHADIRYASVSGVNVSGVGVAIGGLVGFGENANIRYAYVLGGSVSGEDSVGGLVGFGEDADIRYAYVLGGSVSGNNSVGGLVGDGIGAQINYSYAAPGLISGGDEDVVGGLIGFTNSGTAVTATYWDNQTTMQSMSAGNLGVGYNTTALQSPTDFTGIYADWGNAWCNTNTGEDITSSSQPLGFIRVWDLGNSTQYPALNCVPGGLSAQGR